MKNKFDVNLELLVNKKLIDSENFTVEVIISDETPVLRQTWDGEIYTIIFQHDEESVDMSRAEILPILWNHNDNGLPIGSYENVRLENKQLKAKAVFDKDDTFAMTILNKVKSGHIKTLSVGASILAKTVTKEKDGSYTVRATKWQPFEGSFTGNPANPNARVSLSMLTEDAINFNKQGEEMDLKQVLEFLSNATVEDKNEIKKKLGIDAEVETLSNKVKDLEVKLSNATSIDAVVQKANKSIQDITLMITSETFSNVLADKKKDAITSIKLSNTGEFNKLEFENALLKHAMASKAPSAGDKPEEDVYEKQNLTMAGSL